MNDIEKLFKEKLAQHPVAPPPGVWEQLQQAQAAEEREGGWWWIAASVALFLLLGSVFLINYRSIAPANSVATELKSGEDQKAVEKISPVPLAEEKVIAKVQTTPLEKIKSIPVANEVRKNSELKLPVEAVEIKRPTTLAKLNPTIPKTTEYDLPKLVQVLPDQAIAQALGKANQSVTIIYKSGTVKKSEPNRPLEKAFAFLTNVKEGGVGFSELRSAKSEIISKAFSNKQESMPTE
ncbi:MAG: hypothetical protein AAF944_17985 [Bacteroidota bacterium]